MEKLDTPSNLSTLSRSLLTNFQKNHYFNKEIFLNIQGESKSFQFVVFIGETEYGVFAGSRVSSSIDNLWEHAIIEAIRNYNNSIFYGKHPESINLKNKVATRLMYFSKNKDEALKQIAAATNTDWPSPEILLLREYDTQIDSVYLWRCLMKDFVGWHLGDEKRFVY
jgi:hypothetical protein